MSPVLVPSFTPNKRYGEPLRIGDISEVDGNSFVPLPLLPLTDPTPAVTAALLKVTTLGEGKDYLVIISRSTGAAFDARITCERQVDVKGPRRHAAFWRQPA